MKFVIIIVYIILIQTGCSSHENHSFLGETPSIANKYQDKIEKLHKELLNVTDTEGGQKILHAIAELKNQADEELQNYFSSIENLVTIPFTQLINRKIFNIQSIEIVQIRFNQIEIKAIITAGVDSGNPIFTYLRFTDESGNNLPGWIVLLSPPDMFKGRNYTVKGSYKGIHNLKKATGIIVRSAEEFQNSSFFNN
jgi:hypothetical protein